MDEREKIKARIKELRYTERGLSMKLFGKPDRIRDFFRGKSEHFRADTYKAVMAELWPETNQTISLNEIKEREIGLLRTIEALIQAILERQVLPKADLDNAFNYHLRQLRTVEKKPIAAEVLDQFLDFLHSVPFGEAIAGHAQSQQPHQNQSEKKKS